MHRWRSSFAQVAVLVAVAVAVSGCSGSASTQVLAKSRVPLKGAAVQEGDAPVLHGALARSISVFGVDLLSEIAADDENLVVSPFSAYSALGLTLAAADGETLDEMRRALRADGMTGAEADSSYADLLAQFRYKVKGTPARLEIANSIWLQKDLEVENDFLERDADYYGAQIARLDMPDKAAPRVINDWVRGNTAGRIKRLIDSLDPATIAVLCNAVYFKDAWWTPFEKSQTADRDFHLPDGTTVKVPTMTGGADGSHIDTATYEAVALPTKGGAEFWIVVPKGDKKPADVLASLKNIYAGGATLQTIASSGVGRLFLPKFDIEWKGSLKEPLQALGMRRAFDAGAAEFPHLSPTVDEIAISEVVQAATTTIDEDGLEAAAATEVGMVATAGAAGEPFELHADRPFVYAITMGDAMLFIGVVNDPRP